MFVPIHLTLLVLVLIGAVVLQVFLSKREGKIPGLVLPLLTLILSIIAVLNLTATPEATALQTVGMYAATFLLYNIPTVILLAIYFGCRERSKKKKQLDKMNVQDLG